MQSAQLQQDSPWLYWIMPAGTLATTALYCLEVIESSPFSWLGSSPNSNANSFLADPAFTAGALSWLVAGIALSMATFGLLERARPLRCTLARQEESEALPPPTQSAKHRYVVPASWIEHAYPLQQLSVHVQGTRHTSRERLIWQLEEVVRLLQQDHDFGELHDDDFGFRFELRSSDGPSFFEGPAGSKLSPKNVVAR